MGSGEDETMLRALAEKLDVTGVVDFAGEIEEARPLYAGCDIVAQPSRWEGCPYSILEAMAARRAVVATAVGGVPEVITPDTGIAYHPGRAEVLAEQLVALAQDEAWRDKMGHAARRRIEKRFDAELMVEATARVYKNL
jgi:glycosyltransferase involved in cell wall biosynthesis